jgi:cell division protein FtsZ
VSVVATGIDHAGEVKAHRPATTTTTVPTSTPESRLAELTQKLRADQQRLADRIERSRGDQNAAAQPAAAASSSAAHAQDAIENAARAAVAAAVLPMTTDDVTIRPMQPKPFRAAGGFRTAGSQRLHSTSAGADRESRAMNAPN